MIFHQLKNVVQVASPASDCVQKINQSIGQVELLGVKFLHFNDQARLAEVSRPDDHRNGRRGE